VIATLATRETWGPADRARVEELAAAQHVPANPVAAS
jgi:hypothetical protein